MSDNIFFDQLKLLTGNRIDRLTANRIIHLPEKYHPLLGNTVGKCNLTLNELSHLITGILSRKEEYGDADLDDWGRFDHGKSHLAQNTLDQSPIVDELIVEVAKQLGLTVRTSLPSGKKAALCLTHDVDLFDGRSYLAFRKMWWIYRAHVALLKGSKDAYRQYLEKIRRWSDYHPRHDPLFAFDKWMELEDRYGFRSTFFFFGLKRALSREGRLYSSRDRKVRETIRRLDKNGWEIALHASYRKHLDLNHLKMQKRLLEDAFGKKVIGCRHHFLRVRFPESWHVYQGAGFNYSSNMGWGAGFDGFRAGTCIPYRPFPGQNLMEIPFQLMDSATIQDPDQYCSTFTNYLRKVKKVGGCLVTCFHQEYFDEVESPGTNRTYRMILETISRDQELWVAPLRDVYNHFYYITEGS